MGLINQSVTDLNINLNSAIDYVTYFSKLSTQKTVDTFGYFNMQVSYRWASYFILLLSIGTIYLSIGVLKKMQPIIKIVLVGLSLILIAGLLIPW